MTRHTIGTEHDDMNLTAGQVWDRLSTTSPRDTLRAAAAGETPESIAAEMSRFWCESSTLTDGERVDGEYIDDAESALLAELELARAGMLADARNLGDDDAVEAIERWTEAEPVFNAAGEPLILTPSADDVQRSLRAARLCTATDDVNAYLAAFAERIAEWFEARHDDEEGEEDDANEAGERDGIVDAREALATARSEYARGERDSMKPDAVDASDPGLRESALAAWSVGDADTYVRAYCDAYTKTISAELDGETPA